MAGRATQHRPVTRAARQQEDVVLRTARQLLDADHGAVAGDPGLFRDPGLERPPREQAVELGKFIGHVALLGIRDNIGACL